jgi:hypothetical protein
VKDELSERTTCVRLKCVFVVVRCSCGLLIVFRRKAKRAYQCGSRQNQACVCQVSKLKSGGGNMPSAVEVAAVAQGRRQVSLVITLEAALKRRLKNGSSSTSIR